MEWEISAEIIGKSLEDCANLVVMALLFDSSEKYSGCSPNSLNELGELSFQKVHFSMIFSVFIRYF